MQTNHWGEPPGAFRRRGNLEKEARDQARVATEQRNRQYEESSTHAVHCLQQENAQLLWKLRSCKERLQREEKSVKILKNSNAELRSSIQQLRRRHPLLEGELQGQRQTQELQQQRQQLEAALREIDGHQMEMLLVRSQMMHIEVTARHWQEEKQQVHCSIQQLQGLFKELLCKLKHLKGVTSTPRQPQHEAMGNCSLGNEEKAVQVGKQTTHPELLADNVTQSLKERNAALESEVAECKKIIAYQREALAFFPPMPPFAAVAGQTSPLPAEEPRLQAQLQGLVGLVQGTLEELQEPDSSNDQQDQQAVGQDGGAGASEGTDVEVVVDTTCEVELSPACGEAPEGAPEGTDVEIVVDTMCEVELSPACREAPEGAPEGTDVEIVVDTTCEVELSPACGEAPEGAPEGTDVEVVVDTTCEVELSPACGEAPEGAPEGEELELHEPSAADATVEVVASTPQKAKKKGKKKGNTPLLGAGKDLFGALGLRKVARGDTASGE